MQYGRHEGPLVLLVGVLHAEGEQRSVLSCLLQLAHVSKVVIQEIRDDDVVCFEFIAVHVFSIH